ncbi:NmrA family NAD(P)-binding protein [Dermatobacter hominis]|uniref:NmrA family NAD(P)-binding protein n=1 Tax=Dermatobacter hominis TaxID=2884263 RepID=UPI001D126670|nr:NmrA family NAD(P)-binding protein [Dermatobacter hominis]UDY36320.1 hypothetical protein LH044_02005 [Dermatobacter hominis]
MTDNEPTILILGGTGKTGRRIASRLRDGGVDVRTAARSGADVTFDWDDPTTHDAALEGVTGLYLVPPALDLSFPPAVADLLDRAEAAGTTHVTYLSARGVDRAPAEVPLRAVELDLAGRDRLRHTVLRPSWFMQNFSEFIFLPGVLAGEIAVPTGDGAEAFVHVDDIADAAVAALLDPSAHDGRGYTLTGPEALTFAEAAARIGAVTGRPVRHVDVDRGEWIDAAVGSGVPPEYAEVLAALLDVIRDGGGAWTSDDVVTATGHGPRDFADYLADPAVAATWSAPVTA